MAEAKRRGRPTKAPTGSDRVSLGLRVTANIKKKLDDAAAASGRSQSQEAEIRLERSFEKQGLLTEVLTLAYGPQWAKFFTAAHENGILTMKADSTAALKQLINKFIDETIPLKGSSKKPEGGQS